MKKKTNKKKSEQRKPVSTKKTSKTLIPSSKKSTKKKEIKKIKSKQSQKMNKETRIKKEIPKKEKKEVKIKSYDKSEKKIVDTDLKNKSVIQNQIKETQVKPNMNVNQSTPFFTILFVCTGNMCRSPIAEGILKKRIEEEFKGEEKDFIIINSCGIYAYDGNKPSENALKISRQNSTDITYIRSKSINKLIIDESDIIFALSVEHLNYIHDNYFSAKQKTYLLKLFGENRLPQMADSIPDPMGFTIEYYGKTFIEIKNAIDKVFPQIREMILKKLQNKP